MPHTITIEAAAAGLNQFVNKNGSQINQMLKTGLEFERDLPKIACEDAYTGQDIDVGSLLQPYQPAFTPNNTEAFDGITNFLRPMKVDLLFTAEQLEKFRQKWKPNWFTPNPEDIRSTYAGYLLGQHVLPQLTEEVNLASYKGAFSAPTAGTPGAVLDSVDGFETNIVAQINAGRLVPINTGALVEATMEAQIRTFCKGVPMPYRYKQGTLYMSKTNAQKYADNYADNHPNHREIEETPDQMVLRVDHYNKRIVGLTCMEGSDRIILVFNNLDSMLIGNREGFADFFQFRFQAFDRTLKVMAEIYRFYGFETCLHMFVNDQGIIV